MDFLGKIAQAHKKTSKKAKQKKGRDFDWEKQTMERACLKIAYVGTNYFGLAFQDYTNSKDFFPANAKKSSADDNGGGGDDVDGDVIETVSKTEDSSPKQAAASSSSVKAEAEDAGKGGAQKGTYQNGDEKKGQSHEQKRKPCQNMPFQPDAVPTVEGCLVEALMRTKLIKDRDSSNMQRCGRTDRGVHAAGNYFSLDMRVANRPFGMVDEKTGMVVPDPRLKMINGVLPADIRVLEIKAVTPKFDSRRSCLYRTYKYFFVREDYDIERMRTAAGYLIGRHDFRNLCKMNLDQTTNFMRVFLNCEFRVIRTNNGHLHDACRAGGQSSSSRATGSSPISSATAAANPTSSSSAAAPPVAGRKRSHDEAMDGGDSSESADIDDGPAKRICAPTLRKVLEDDREAGWTFPEGLPGGEGSEGWEFLDKEDDPAAQKKSKTEANPSSNQSANQSDNSDFLPPLTTLGPLSQQIAEMNQSSTPKKAFHSDTMNLTSEHDVIEVTISGMSFLWHQIRCIMQVLFMVGSGQEQPEIVKTLLDIEKTPRKPNYPLADEGGLVLYDCVFDAKRDFLDGKPFKPNQDAFADLQRQALRNAAIMGCLGGDFRDDKESHLRNTGNSGNPASSSPTGPPKSQNTLTNATLAVHNPYNKQFSDKIGVPLLKRAVCPSLEEKLDQYHQMERKKGLSEEKLKKDMSRCTNDFDVAKLKKFWKLDQESLGGGGK